jgi:site-specific DNA recombinase
MRLALSLRELTEEAPLEATITRVVPMSIKRRGSEMRLVIEGHSNNSFRADPTLVKAIARAHRWLDDLMTGRASSIAEIAAREAVTDRYVRRLLPLGLMAPEIVEAIAQGHHPIDLTAETLVTRLDLPLDWAAQKQAIGLA